MQEPLEAGAPSRAVEERATLLKEQTLKATQAMETQQAVAAACQAASPEAVRGTKRAALARQSSVDVHPRSVQAPQDGGR